MKLGDAPDKTAASMTDDGGHLVPAEFAADEFRRVVKHSLFVTFSDDFYDWWREWHGLPPRARGLAYWQQREREAVAAAHPVRRLRRFVRRISAEPLRRIRNAVAALADQWEASDWDD